MLIKAANPSAGNPPLFAIAILSATALAYEILLIRLFSIVQWHHFAYMIISLALLGYGASGTFLSLTQKHLIVRYPAAFLANVGLFGVSLLPCFLAAQTIPFNPEEMLWDWRQAWHLTPIYLLLSLPFFFAANAIALTFAYYRPIIDRIYAIDLLGAGTGSLVVVLLLYSLKPLDALTVLAICGTGCLSFAAFDLPLKKRSPIVVLTLVLITFSVWMGTTAELAMSPYKDLSQARRVGGAEVVAEASSPLGLLTLVDNQRIPVRYAPGLSINSASMPPPQLALFVDGNSLGAISDTSGFPASLDFLDQLVSALPYHLKPVGRVLILGSGDGIDVLQALYQGAGEIEAVELNPQLVALTNTQFADHAGSPYRQPAVTVHNDEARGFVDSSDQRYDLVVLPSQDGVGVGSSGLYALNENYLYTIEALESYLDHLDNNGYLVMPQWLQLPPRNTLRLFATAVQALKNRGVQLPGDQLILVRGWQTSVLLVKNSAITAAEIQALRTFCKSRSLDLAWLPGLRKQDTNRFNRLQESDFFNAAQQLLGKQNASFIAHYKFDIQPASDDRPYFGNFFKWSSLGELLALRKQGGMALVESGYPVLLLTLLQSVLISSVLILVPLFIFRKALPTHSSQQVTKQPVSPLPGSGHPRPDRIEPAATGNLATVIIYFTAIGLAFLFIEIAFIQKFMLFLYHPVITVSAILAAFLVFAGLGSLWSQRMMAGRDAGAIIFIPVLSIVLLCLTYLTTLDRVFTWLSFLPMVPKIAASALLVAPLAFFMGMPFPLALTLLGSTRPQLIPFAWGINGCASVLSAVLATLLAIHFGFSVVILLALGFYLVAAFSMPRSAG